MDNTTKHADSSLVFRVFLCLLLGIVLFLFIRNNDLLAQGGRNLRNPEALIMLAIFGFPFLLSCFHLIRGWCRRQDTGN